jgi:hypothetical protein
VEHTFSSFRVEKQAKQETSVNEKAGMLPASCWFLNTQN